MDGVVNVSESVSSRARNDVAPAGGEAIAQTHKERNKMSASDF